MIGMLWRETRRLCQLEAVLFLAAGVTVLGFGICFWLPGCGWLPLLAWQLGLSVLLIGLAIWDWRIGMLPNRGTLPLIGIGLFSLATQLLQRTVSPAALVWVAGGWAVGVFVWWLRVLRGGDVKLIMGLLALFPDPRFIWILLGVLLAGALIAIVVQDGRPGLRRLGALFYTVFAGRTLPTRDDIEASYLQPGGSHRLGYLFSLAGLVFIWLAHP